MNNHRVEGKVEDEIDIDIYGGRKNSLRNERWKLADSFEFEGNKGGEQKEDKGRYVA